MGLSTVRSLSRFLVLLLGLAFLLPSCVDNDERSVGSQADSGDTVMPTHFAREVFIDFTNDAELTESEGSAQASLSLQAVPLEREIFQWVLGPPVARRILLVGEEGQVDGRTAYTPTLVNNDRFGGVDVPVYSLPKPRKTSTVEVGAVEYVWTLPESSTEDKPTLLRIGAGLIQSFQHTVIDGDEIVVRTEYRFEYDEFGNRTGGITGLLINDHLYSLEELGYAAGFGSPVFTSPYSGQHSIRRTDPDLHGGGSQFWNYTQKSLGFAEEFPDFDLQSDEPIEIRNTVQWDDGSPAEDVKWSVQIDGQEIKGEGTDLAARWDPKKRELAQAVEDLEAIGYSVHAQATSYTINGQKIPYEVRVGGSVPGKTKLRIFNEEVSPEEPFAEPETGVTVTAEVITLEDFVVAPEDIEWRVDVKDPQGEPVIEYLAEGTGHDVLAFWDGMVDGEAVEDPGSYVFEIHAEACEGGGEEEPPAGRIARPRLQLAEDPECYSDKLEVPLRGETGVLEILDAETDKLLASSEPEPYTGGSDLIVERPGTGIKAWTRIKNQARRLYISDHGLSSGALFAEGRSVLPEDIGEEWKDNLELVIVAGCSILNIGNFNGWTSYGASPGRAWIGRTKPGCVMLGYNATAPAANLNEAPGSAYADTRILARYRQQLPTQQSEYSDPDEAQAMAWLLANASMEVRLADNACAITDLYYYFIRTTSRSGGDIVIDPHNQNDSDAYSTERGIWRLHRDHWDKLGSKAFDVEIKSGAQGKTLMHDLPNTGPGEADRV